MFNCCNLLKFCEQNSVRYLLPNKMQQCLSIFVFNREFGQISFTSLINNFLYSKLLVGICFGIWECLPVTSVCLFSIKTTALWPFLWIRFNYLKATNPLWWHSLLFTTKSPGVPRTHLINVRMMKEWVDFVATK